VRRTSIADCWLVVAVLAVSALLSVVAPAGAASPGPPTISGQVNTQAEENGLINAPVPDQVVRRTLYSQPTQPETTLTSITAPNIIVAKGSATITINSLPNPGISLSGSAGAGSPGEHFATGGSSIGSFGAFASIKYGVEVQGPANQLVPVTAHWSGQVALAPVTAVTYFRESEHGNVAFNVGSLALANFGVQGSSDGMAISIKSSINGVVTTPPQLTISESEASHLFLQTNTVYPVFLSAALLAEIDDGNLKGITGGVFDNNLVASIDPYFTLGNVPDPSDFKIVVSPGIGNSPVAFPAPPSALACPA
jgi:hypothetical protein